MARSKLIPLTATLFSLLGGVALATPGDERGSVEAELFNETADNGDPVAVLRASGNYAFLPEGTQLTVLLALPVVEGEEQASVTSMDVLVDADGHFELERRWPGKTAAPLRYIASVDLVVNRQVQAVRVWLVREFGYAWDEVHDEAEVLEHAISDRLLAGIDDLLGHPLFDPHGDAIPRADGTVVREPFVLLADAAAGHTGRVLRVSDRDADVLRVAEAAGMTVATEVTVTAAGVRVGDAETALDDDVRQAVWLSA